MVAIVNYGVGNVQAFSNLLKELGVQFIVASRKQDLESADRIILPGVGAFDWAMNKLNNSGMREVLDDLVLTEGRPVLGVCVGMQMMANRSDEGSLCGLGWIDGEVKKISQPNNSSEISLPHMGWNEVIACREHPILGGELAPRFYFLHSYIMHPRNADYVVAKTEYFVEFTSVVARSNIIGIQCHPEKSHGWGKRFIERFSKADLCCDQE